MAKLSLARAELAVQFCDGARLQAALQQCVYCIAARFYEDHVLSFLEEGLRCGEAHVDQLMSCLDDLVDLAFGEALDVYESFLWGEGN